MPLPIRQAFTIPEIAERWTGFKLLDDFRTNNDKYEYIINTKALSPWFKLSDTHCLLIKLKHNDKVFVGFPSLMNHAEVTYIFEWCRQAGTHNFGVPVQHFYHGKSDEEIQEERQVTVPNKILLLDKGYCIKTDKSGELTILVYDCLFEHLHCHLRDFLPKSDALNNSPFLVIAKHEPKFLPSQILVSSDVLLEFESKNKISLQNKSQQEWSQSLKEYNDIIFSFGASELYKKYGINTQKQLIAKWIGDHYQHKTRDEIRVLKQLITEHYGIS